MFCVDINTKICSLPCCEIDLKWIASFIGGFVLFAGVAVYESSLIHAIGGYVCVCVLGRKKELVSIFISSNLKRAERKVDCY